MLLSQPCRRPLPFCSCPPGAAAHELTDVEQVADGEVSAEHVLAEDPAIAVKADAFGVEDDLVTAAEVTHDVAARRVDLLEEETAVDVRPGDDCEVLDRLADRTLMDDRTDHGFDY